jgi:hypothetical protein
MSKRRREMALASTMVGSMTDGVDDHIRLTERPGVRVGPVVSQNERMFIAGSLSSDDYIRLGQEESELLVLRLEHMKSRRRGTLEVFMVAASTVYVTAAVVFLILDQTAGSVAALAISTIAMLSISISKILLPR